MKRVLTMFALISTPSMLFGAEMIINGDFEQDVDQFTTWPGYVADGDNPAEVPEWFGTGGRGINPVASPAIKKNKEKRFIAHGRQITFTNDSYGSRSQFVRF